MVIGDARTQTFATSQPPPDAPRPKIIGLLNGPIQWGDRTWAAVSWDTIANWPARTRGELLLHESFHIVQPQLVNGPAGANEHLDAVDGRYWLRLEWRARTGATGKRRSAGRSRRAGLPTGSSRGIPIKSKASASFTFLKAWPRHQTVLVAPSQTTRSRAGSALAGAEDEESFVRTFTYNSGPAYGLLLDAASPGWPRTVRGSDDPPAMLMRALGVQPVADAAAAAARYGGAELRAAEEQREQQQQARIAGLRQRFVDGPVFVMPCGGGGTSNSLGAVVIPGAGTVRFNAYRLSGLCGTLTAENGVLEATDGGSRRLPAPVRGDDVTISGDGWTFRAAAGWVVREGARRGDYEAVRQQP